MVEVGECTFHIIREAIFHQNKDTGKNKGKKNKDKIEKLECAGSDTTTHIMMCPSCCPPKRVRAAMEKRDIMMTEIKDTYREAKRQRNEISKKKRIKNAKHARKMRRKAREKMRKKIATENGCSAFTKAMNEAEKNRKKRKNRRKHRSEENAY